MAGRKDQPRVRVENGDFGSPAELADLLEGIGLRLHAKNRIAGGESGFLWHLAEIIRGAGRLAARAGDAELQVLFGDGHQAGSLAPDRQLEHLWKLLNKQQTPSELT